MQGRPGRFSHVRWVQGIACAVAMLGALALFLLAISGKASNSGVWMIAAAGFVLFLAVMMLTFVPLLIKIESTLARQLTELRDLREMTVRHTTLLTSIAEHTRLSETAKSLVHRSEEYEALHGTIRDAIRNEEWDHASGLVEDMERRLGYTQEAERFREELDNARGDAIQQKLGVAIEMIERHFAAHDWPLAENELERLNVALPDEPKIASLQDRMGVLKQQHKDELRVAWEEALRRNDTDQAIDVLKELDQYLSRAEATTLQSSARHVFKDKLLQLGVQFRFAVNERRWRDALRTGLELVRDFPNARMASEVREVLDTLRDRAHHAGTAPQSGEAEPAATSSPS